MLIQDPKNRIKLQEILSHPFFDPNLPTKHFSEAFVFRSNDSDLKTKKHRDVKMNIPLFSTANLKPMSQSVKHGNIEITAFGEVIVNFSEDDQILRLNSNGTKCSVISKLDGTLIKTYKYEQLPPEFHKRVRYVARFIDLVRSKCQKVYYSERLYSTRAEGNVT